MGLDHFAEREDSIDDRPRRARLESFGDVLDGRALRRVSLPLLSQMLCPLMTISRTGSVAGASASAPYKSRAWQIGWQRWQLFYYLFIY
jgi:hypothetical protein